MTDTKSTVTGSRVCTECGNPLGADAPATKLTCKPKCRKARSRRLKREAGELPWPDPDRQRKNATPPPHHQKLAEAIRKDMPDAIHETLNEELRPVVREAITEDVLRSIHSAVGMVPSALAAIQEDLGSSDALLRQRAATLLLKYTLGHPALIPPEEADGGKQIIVNFEGMARPAAPVSAEIEATAQEVEVEASVVHEDGEQRECDSCKASKPDAEFVENSYRCIECFEKQQEVQRELLENT